jgi:hypothetical protein
MTDVDQTGQPAEPAPEPQPTPPPTPEPVWRPRENSEIEKLRQRLLPYEWSWLERGVELGGPDLDVILTPALLELFPPGANDKGPVNDARLIRTFVWQAWIKLLCGLLEPVRGNIRSVWYQMLEGFYLKHGLVEIGFAPEPRGAWRELLVGVAADEIEEMSRRRRPEDRIIGTMTDVVGDMIAHRLFRFDGPFRFQEPIEAKYDIGRNRPWVLFFTEKEGLYWLCRMLYNPGESSAYSVTGMASNGQPSFLALEYFARELRQRGYRTLVIGAFCDFDPFGYSIAQQLEAKMRLFGFKVVTYLLGTPDLFTPEQIARGRDWTPIMTPPEEGEHDPYRSFRKQLENWIRQTGGVDGRPIGLHIDVLSDSRKRDVAERFRDRAVNRQRMPWPRVEPKLFPEGIPADQLERIQRQQLYWWDEPGAAMLEDEVSAWIEELEAERLAGIEGPRGDGQAGEPAAEERQP